jgi:deoxycytidylate deaminase
VSGTCLHNHTIATELIVTILEQTYLISCYPSQIYVALFPCNECAKVIIQSGITEVVYQSDKYADSVSMRASRKLFSLAGVTLRQHTPARESITIEFK